MARAVSATGKGKKKGAKAAAAAAGPGIDFATFPFKVRLFVVHLKHK